MSRQSNEKGGPFRKENDVVFQKILVGLLTGQCLRFF